MERCGLSNEINDAGPPDVLAFGKSRNHLNEYKMRFDRQFTRGTGTASRNFAPHEPGICNKLELQR
jgi:hypothetical protein